jgi:hypothetical protein
MASLIADRQAAANRDLVFHRLNFARPNFYGRW